MIRVVLLVREEQFARLKELAIKNKASVAQLHRQALDEFLKGDTLERLAKVEADLLDIRKRISELEKLQKSS